MMLAAYNEGIDSCWINFFNPDELAKALGLPEEEEILMLLDLGIAADGTGALPNHNSRNGKHSMLCVSPEIILIMLPESKKPAKAFHFCRLIFSINPFLFS